MMETRPTVLLVDDEEPFVEAIADGLSVYKNYFNVRTAFNGAEAVKVLKLHPVNLIVTGLSMPKMDGFELLAYVNRNYPHINVIMMSAYATPKIKEIVKNMGVLIFLDKPFYIDELADSIIFSLNIKIYPEDISRNITASVKNDFEKLLNAAIAGDSKAQFRIGRMHFHGKGVNKNYGAAIKWFEKAAMGGHNLAQYSMGMMYYDGNGVEKDYKEAIKWFEKAAHLGNGSAQYNMGMMYIKGEGVKQNFEEAFKWIKKSAEQGNIYAQFSLGLMYSNGDGVKTDYKEARKWMKKAAEHGYASAQCNLGTMYIVGEGVERNYVEALKWFEKAAALGSQKAKTILNKIKSYPAKDVLGVTPLQKIKILQYAGFVNDLMKGFYDTATVYIKEGRYGEAIFCLKELLERTADARQKAMGLYALGQIMEQLSKFEDALSYYREASFLCDNSLDLFYCVNNNTGYCLCMLGRYQEAEKYCRMAIAADGSRPNAFKNLGLALEGQGHLREAINTYINATRLDARDVRATINLEKLLQRHPELNEEYNEELKECKEITASAKEQIGGPKQVH